MVRVFSRISLLFAFAAVWQLVPGVVAANDGTWNNVAPPSTLPPPRRDLGLAYDSQGDRLVVIGGSGGGTATWLLNLSGTPAWTSVAETAPPNLSGDDRAVYDPVNNRVVLVTAAMQVWALDLANPTAWSLLAAGSPPPPRSFYAATYDALRNRLLIFGGGPYTGIFNDVWALPLSGPSQVWTQIVGTGTAPAPRWGPSAAYDAARDRLIVVSGSLDAGYALSNDVWALSLGGTPAWTKLAPSGPAPRNRMLAATIYDPTQDRLLLCSGYSGSDGDLLGDIWSLGLQPPVAWTQLNPAGGPPHARWSFAAVYRSALPQMLIFGGSIGGSTSVNDTWALEFTPPTGPPAVLGFQPSGGRVGDPVTIQGARLQNALDVRFNGVSAAILSATFTAITTQVPTGATTGSIRVVTPDGEGVSADAFFVGERPVVDAAIPDSGKVGDLITLQGTHFTGTTEVSFGGTGGASFRVLSDMHLEARIDSLAKSGPISITTPAATGTSTLSFKVVPPDTIARIMSVRDVPNDQGGVVSLRWLRSDFDTSPHRWVTGYRVWRRAALRLTAASAAQAHPTWRREVTANGDVVFWEPIAVIPASYLPGYAYTAPTTQDSIRDSNPYTAFMIQTLTTDPFLFYYSGVDSGYSVDNLTPAQPTAFVAQSAGGGIALHWGLNRESDLRGYRLHRGTSTFFEPSASNLIAAKPDTGFHDPSGTFTSFYKLAAVDIHGNISLFALANPDAPTAALASVVRADAQSDRVHLVWYVSGNPGIAAKVYRHADAADWTQVVVLSSDGSGFVSYDDFNVHPGDRIGYRLGIWNGDAEALAGEAWVDVPMLTFALYGMRPNPGHGPIAVEFSIPDAAPARVELLDVTGRRVASRRVEALGPGRHSLLLGNLDLPPAVYLVRLVRGGDERTAKAIVLP